MSLYKFEPDDILFNRIRTHPKVKFVIHTSSVYYNDNVSVFGTPNGCVSINELGTLNASGLDYHSFITKGSSRIGFKTISVSAFNTLDFGDVMTSSLPMTASISSEHYGVGDARLHVDSIRNTTNYYTTLSDAYAFSSSLGDKETQELRLFSIPSIFYDSGIKKGSVDLKFYVTGTLIGHAQDLYKNGELIQVGPSGSTGSGSVAGLVYYSEGLLLMTGSWALNTSTDFYEVNGNPRWVYFGSPGDGFGETVSSSYSIEFSGTNYVPVVTMLAHADKAAVNHSNNPAYIQYGQSSGSANPLSADTGSLGFYEKTNIQIKNVGKYPYTEETGSFKKETYISKIGIYDEEKNLIGIAKVATPVRKRENDQFTFKMKLDY